MTRQPIHTLVALLCCFVGLADARVTVGGSYFGGWLSLSHWLPAPNQDSEELARVRRQYAELQGLHSDMKRELEFWKFVGFVVGMAAVLAVGGLWVWVDGSGSSSSSSRESCEDQQLPDCGGASVSDDGGDSGDRSSRDQQRPDCGGDGGDGDYSDDDDGRGM